jgi:hypothetical protein
LTDFKLRYILIYQGSLTASLAKFVSALGGNCRFIYGPDILLFYRCYCAVNDAAAEPMMTEKDLQQQ